MYNQSFRRQFEWSSVVLLLVVVIVMLMGSALAYSDNAAITAETEILKEMDSGRINSAAVAIMDNGEITYTKGFGIADLERDIANRFS